jgi:CHAD domain-containing protein
MRGDDQLRDVGLGLLTNRIRKAKDKVGDAAHGNPTAVHELRVAIRKIRGALSVLSETVIDRRSIRKPQRRLRRLFSALGDARDDDVMLARIKRLAEQRDLMAASINRLEHEIERDRKRARKRLEALMDAAPPKQALDELARAAAGDQGKAGRKRKGRKPNDVAPTLVRHFVGSALLSRYEQVLAYEVALPAPLPVLHRLRISIKKLRYAIDFFEDVLGPEARGLGATLKRAQDELGELHDHSVATAFVAKFEESSGPKQGLRQVREADEADAERLLAAFAVTWGEITGEGFSRSLFAAVGRVSGPQGASEPRLALRHAEPN